MKRCGWTAVLGVLAIGFATVTLADDVVVDGRVITTGGWYEFPDGSIQSAAAYARWAQVAVVDIMGRGDYTDPVAAMSALATWCGTPSASNPCLLKILAGYYNIGSSGLVMQPYVDIEGSGRNATFIRSAKGGSCVRVANHSELRSLTVVNHGNGAYVQGISIGGLEQPRVTDVDVVVSGANAGNTGVYLGDSAPVIESMSVYVDGGDSANGIDVDNSSGVLNDVDVHVTALPANVATGVLFYLGSSLVMKDSRVYAGEGYTSYGIQISSASPQIERVTVVVEADHFGRGFQNLSGTATLTDSFIDVIGGVNGVGVLTAGSAVSNIRGVEIDVSGATVQNTGVSSDGGSSVRLEHTSISATGGDIAYAVGNWDGAETTLVDVTAEASAASSSNIGVYNQSASLLTATNLVVEANGTNSDAVRNGTDGGTVTIDRSILTGGSFSARNDSSSADFFVGASTLDGTVTTDLTCFGNHDASYAPVACP